MQKDGIGSLFPPQQLAIEAGVLDGHSVLLSCNTGSGKTMIAELSALKVWADRRKKTVYVVPLRALAMEKHEDFKKYEPLGLKSALSIGDLDSDDAWLKDADVIVCTFEKLDSLIRHKALWLKDVGLAVLDEIHEIGSNRGPTLEMVALWLKSYRVQFLGLSATIGNSDEVARWLGAKLVSSDFRPVPLHEGVYWNGTLEFSSKPGKGLVGGEMELVEDELKADKQALIFMNTRREAEAFAIRAQKVCAKFGDAEALSKLAHKVLHALESPTEQCRKLAECVGNGCAFHHAGLVNKQRKLIEDAYRTGVIKFISATVTLVAGVNLPSHRIIIRSIKRYDEDWPVSTYKQAVGRAGRIRFDTEGESVVVCRSEFERQFVLDTYINGTPESITSRLGSLPVLRMHVLGAIAHERFTREKLKWFFFDSFYAFHRSDNIGFGAELDTVIDQLKKWGMATEAEYLNATPLGRRVSELYIDPATGRMLAEELYSLIEGKDNTFGFLQLISQAVENYPLPSIRKNEVESVQEKLDLNVSQLLRPGPLPWEPEFEEFFQAAKLAVILHDWVEEMSEEYLLATYNLAPGDLRSKVEIAKWLLFAAHEIAGILNKKTAKGALAVLGKRVDKGCKGELLPLVELKGIGRVRARRLWRAGLKNREDVAKNREKAAKTVGEKVISKALA